MKILNRMQTLADETSTQRINTLKWVVRIIVISQFCYAITTTSRLNTYSICATLAFGIYLGTELAYFTARKARA